ncbi:MAG: hypothetical protein ACK4TL_13560 [Hyphomicrobiaceae bacterium]
MSTLMRRAFLACRTLHRTSGLTGALAAAILASTLPAAADPPVNPGHAIANRFAEDARRAEAAREAQRQEAARKPAQQRTEQTAQAAREKARKAHEAEMLARARAEAEERRKLEEQAARLDALRAEREAREAEAERQRAERARLIEAAREAEQARIVEEARKAEEVKRTAEALRAAAEKAAAAEAARKVEEARRAEMARKAQEEAQRADIERLAEEARRAEYAAWAAEEARRAAETRKAEDARRAEEIRKANEALRIAAERAAAEQAARAEVERRAEETRRAVARATAEEARRVADMEADAEIARLAERLRRIREEHLARHSGTAKGTVVDRADEGALEPTSGRGRMAENEGFRDVPLAPPHARAGTEPRAPETLDAPRHPFNGRVAVILHMEPRYRRGRRYESMDPVLCGAGGCYVSNGPDQPASFLPGRRAVSFGNAIGLRAGACNRAYTCVFRNVDLGTLPAHLQPVDIRVLRHDLRAPERVQTLSSCRMSAGNRLACTGAIHGDGFAMWVIAEAVAERLPPHALEDAHEGGFMGSAQVDAKLNPWGDRW